MRRLLQISILINAIGLCLAGIFIYKTGGISNLFYKLKSKHVIAKMQHRQSQFSNAAICNNCIVFLGDSITEYGEWSELLPKYPILNRGIAGDGIEGVINRLDEIARHDPSMIFLMIGVNDLSFHKIQSVINMYTKLLSSIQELMPQTKLIVQSILPVNNAIYHLGIENEAIDQVNAALREICDQSGLTYLDLGADFKNQENNLKSNYSNDGIHINGIAYNQWKEKLKPWLPIE